jgi:hypothetical protein
MIPDWIEDKVRELADDTLDEHSRAWKRICLIGELVSLYPSDSPEHNAVVAMIAARAHRKKPTQRLYARLWSAIKADAIDGEIRIPMNINPSTARTIIAHDGDIATIRKADAEGWTLKDARLWAQDRTRTVEEKPATLWRVLTREIPAHYRKRVEALSPAEVSEFVGLVRDAIRKHGEG